MAPASARSRPSPGARPRRFPGGAVQRRGDRLARPLAAMAGAGAGALRAAGQRQDASRACLGRRAAARARSTRRARTERVPALLGQAACGRSSTMPSAPPRSRCSISTISSPSAAAICWSSRASRRRDGAIALADLRSRLRAVPGRRRGAARRRADRRRAGQALRRSPTRGRRGGRGLSACSASSAPSRRRSARWRRSTRRRWPSIAASPCRWRGGCSRRVRSRSPSGRLARDSLARRRRPAGRGAAPGRPGDSTS